MIRALHIEDDQDYVKLLREAIIKEYAPIVLESVYSLSEAVSRLNENIDSPYDLLIIDINLPDGSGDEFIPALQGNRHYSNVPIVVLSSESIERLEGIKNNFQIEYMKKPNDFESVCAFIRKVANL
jgi:DNA-binding response OmpR family regulator